MAPRVHVNLEGTSEKQIPCRPHTHLGSGKGRVQEVGVGKWKTHDTSIPTTKDGGGRPCELAGGACSAPSDGLLWTLTLCLTSLLSLCPLTQKGNAAHPHVRALRSFALQSGMEPTSGSAEPHPLMFSGREMTRSQHFQINRSCEWKRMLSIVGPDVDRAPGDPAKLPDRYEM